MENGTVASTAISPDKKLVLSGTKDGRISLWNVRTGKIIGEFFGHRGQIKSLAFTSDGYHVLSSSADNTIRIWRTATREELVKLAYFKNGEWFVITPEGYFSSSLYGHRFLNIKKGEKSYKLNQFYDIFYRPDIVEAKLRGEDISKFITVRIEDAIKSPPPKVEIVSVPEKTQKEKVKIRYTFKSTGGGIGEVRVFQNGKLIQSDGFYRTAKADFGGVPSTGLSESRLKRRLATSSRGRAKTPAPTVVKPKGNVYEGKIEIET